MSISLSNFTIYILPQNCQMIEYDKGVSQEYYRDCVKGDGGRDNDFVDTRQEGQMISDARDKDFLLFKLDPPE